jgi:deltex-like protein
MDLSPQHPAPSADKLVYIAPPTLEGLLHAAVNADTKMHPPLRSSQDDDEDCALCLESLHFGGPSSTIKTCKHQFHTKCIQDCLKVDRKCPICRGVVGGAPQGLCPSGNMSISLSREHCPGFGRAKTIRIDYLVPSGAQLSYHENPGQAYEGTSRRAFLPNNDEGRELLHRLKFAWLHGLAFRIGTSLTTGRQNAVVWSSIHHKTSLIGGPHGFPDPHFIENCNESLTALGVPPATTPFKTKVRPDTFSYQAPRSLHANFDFASVLEEVATCNSTAKPGAPVPNATALPTSPSGTMTIKESGKQFPGYAPSVKILELRYDFATGIQLDYHPNPGVLYSSTERIAFLPSTPEGLRLLTRLKYAFIRGLSFSIGTSLTTGTPNSITWSTIPHKTSVSGGHFGFPDPHYFMNCHQALTALGVPEAEDASFLA